MSYTDVLLFLAAGLVFASILFSKISSRLGVPSLIMFLAVGMLAGPEGIGHISFDDPTVIQALGVLALINILFSGGIESKWSDLRPVLVPGLLLATIGLCINAILIAIAMHFIFALDWLEGLLFGSIIGCTDAAAVFAVLRTKNLSLSNGLVPMAEFESAANDPMAVFLTVMLIALIQSPHEAAVAFVPAFLLQMSIGAAVGFIMGRLIPAIINSLNLDQEGLYPPLTMALSVLTYAIAAFLHGSGYLAAYLAGVVMNGRRFYHKESLIRFHAGLAWLMQIIMFVALGLILRPSQLIGVLPKGLIMGALLLFVARPASVMLALVFSKLSIREKLMASWLGLRGAVPIILGTFTLYSGVPAAHLIADLIFFVVLLSVTLQGTTLETVARWLKVGSRRSKAEQDATIGTVLTTESVLTEVIVPSGSEIVGRSVMSLGFDSNSRVMLIYRDDATLVPSGRTKIMNGDVIVVLAPAIAFPKSLAALSHQGQ
ncbi:MAG: potassium/proton antiporter [Candidatus Kapaibacterium sp.]